MKQFAVLAIVSEPCEASVINIYKKSHAAIAAAAIVVSFYFVAGVIILSNIQYNRNNSANLEDTASVLAIETPALVFTADGEAAAWALRWGPIYGLYRVTLIRRDGQVIFDSSAGGLLMENHLDRPEFQAALTTGKGFGRRKSATFGREYIYAAIAIKDQDDRTAGVLRISRPVPNFTAGLVNSAYPFLLGGFLLILGACAGLYRFSRHFSLSVEAGLKAKLDENYRELIYRTNEAETEGHRLEAVLGSMHEGVIALDSGLNISLVNSRICSLFGIGSENDARGTNILEFSGSAELETLAGEVLSSGQPSELIYKRYVSGIEQHFQVFAAPMKGEEPGVVMVLGDIGRMVKLEHIRKDFVSNVSHELRTPIQVVKGFTENILDSPLDNKEDIRHFAEIIRKNALTMENLTNDLLVLASLEDENNPRIPMEETAIAPLIAEAESMVEIAAGKKNIRIETVCPGDLAARVHSPFIVQAIVNLLDNSVKYSGAGSGIKVNAFIEQGWLVIEVKDGGIGIPSEHLDRIFERFYRVDKARQRAGGTGLGLSIVRHIALLHNGSVEAESHAGEGSAFRLRLPTAKMQPL